MKMMMMMMMMMMLLLLLLMMMKMLLLMMMKMLLLMMQWSLIAPQLSVLSYKQSASGRPLPAPHEALVALVWGARA